MRLSTRMKEVGGSATFAVMEKAESLCAKGVDVISLTAGEPDFDTPEHIKNAGINAIKKGYTRYTPVSGIKELKFAIAEKFKSDNNLDYDISQILVSAGAKNAIYNVLQVICNEGDEVLIPAPYWTSYPEMVKSAGAKPVIIATDKDSGFRLTPGLLRRYISSNTKALILNTPSNPTGVVYSKEELCSIKDVILEHKIYVISDEVYEKIIFDNERHVSIASLGNDIKMQTIVINSVSKAYGMTGWRIGYSAGPEEIIRLAGALQSQSISCPCSISQYAALSALKETPESFIKNLTRTYEKRRNLLIERLGKIPQISFIRPQGAFYLFVDVQKVFGKNAYGKTIKNSTELAETLLENAHIAVVPGSAFGVEGFIRLSFSVSEDEIIQGVERLGRFFSTVC